MLTSERACTCLVFLIALTLMIPLMGCESHRKTTPAISVLQQTTSEERAILETQKMFARLNLSEEQIPRVHDINLNFAVQSQNIALSEDSTVAKTQALTRLLDQKDMALRQVLTPSQHQGYQQMKRATENTLTGKSNLAD